MAHRLAFRLSFSLLVFSKVFVRHLIAATAFPRFIRCPVLLRPQVVLISPFGLTERTDPSNFLKKIFIYVMKRLGNVIVLVHTCRHLIPRGIFESTRAAELLFRNAECFIWQRWHFSTFRETRDYEKKRIPQGKKKEAFWYRSSRSNISLAHAQSFASKHLLCLCAPFQPVTVHDVHVT